MRVNNGLTPQDLKAYGINDVQDIVHNPSYDTLYQEELAPNLEGYERGVLTNLGGLTKAKAKTTTNRSLRKRGST